MIECKVCLMDSQIAEILDDGRCEYCHLTEKIKHDADDFPKLLSKIKMSRRGKYDCLIGISGGEDSSILLYMAVKVWELNPLVIHFDNYWNCKEANNNIEVLINNLNVNFIRIYPDKKEYEDLNDAFLYAGLLDADIPNDIAMEKLARSYARYHNISYILNGHDLDREGSTPKAWTYMDSKYLGDVYERYTRKKLKNYPLLTIWDQLLDGLLGIKHVRPFHWVCSMTTTRTHILEILKSWGWQEYGGKHCENVYTEFIGGWYLPGKFGIDKRIVYLSARIRSGLIDKDQAKQILEQRSPFDTRKLGERRLTIMKLVDQSPEGNRNDYAHYDFKKWKPLIYLLAKMKIVSYMFYYKYCK